LTKTNFVFAVLSFVLVLYATFLTRSGVLEDFSVHSFQNLGINNYLIVFMLVILGLGAGLFFKRMNHIPYKAMDLNTLNRENGLFGSMIVFAASAFLTFIGTSSPIITGIMGSPSQVDISFYDKVNLPVGIVMAILLGITPFLLWIEKDLKLLPRKITLPAILAVVFTVIIVLLGDLDALETIFVLASCFALFANAIVLYRQWKISWRNIAGPISHFGVAIVFVSIIVSGNYALDERIILEKGVAQEVMGHHVTYQGIKPMADGKNILEIQVNTKNGSYTAKPRLYKTNQNEVMREPDVNSGFLTDIYISPLERRTANAHSHGSALTLAKGETKKFKNMEITFNAFKMEPHGDGRSFNVGAVLDVKEGDHNHTVVPILTMGAAGKKSEPVIIPSHGKYTPDLQVILKQIDADKKMVEIEFLGLAEDNAEAVTTPEQLLIEFSTKPFMSILWLGTILLLAGSFIALTQRLKTAA
jgi:cytochrome c-type biogenesis protein CcmF